MQHFGDRTMTCAVKGSQRTIHNPLGARKSDEFHRALQRHNHALAKPGGGNLQGLWQQHKQLAVIVAVNQVCGAALPYNRIAHGMAQRRNLLGWKRKSKAGETHRVAVALGERQIGARLDGELFAADGLYRLDRTLGAINFNTATTKSPGRTRYQIVLAAPVRIRDVDNESHGLSQVCSSICHDTVLVAS